jgi:hypothetical protein
MATLCTSYLTFDCFYPNMSDDELLECVQRGDFAFQEYAICNWLHHLNSILQDKKFKPLSSSPLWMALTVLNNRHEDHVISVSQSDQLSKMDLSDILKKLLALYDTKFTLSSEDQDSRKTTFFRWTTTDQI